MSTGTNEAVQHSTTAPSPVPPTLPPAPPAPPSLPFVSSSSSTADGPPPPPHRAGQPPPTLDSPPRKPTPAGGASVLARVRALEAAAAQQTGGEGDSADSPAAGVAARASPRKSSPAALDRTKLGGPKADEIGWALSPESSEGGDFSPTTLAIPRARPRPLASSPSMSGLVAKRKSWIELGSPDSLDSPVDPTRSPVPALPTSPASPLSVSSGASSPSSFGPATASRSLSSAALAALADTPPRPRPPVPAKSAARLSRTSSRLSSYGDGAGESARSRTNSGASVGPAVQARSSVVDEPREKLAETAVQAGEGKAAPPVRSPSSLIKPPPIVETQSSPVDGHAESFNHAPLSPHSVSTLVPLPTPSAFATPPSGLSHPRPRPALSTSRTPALSMAGSSASSRPSSGVLSPHFEPMPDRNSFFSTGGEQGHEDLTGDTSDWSKVAATPATTADFTPEPSPEVPLPTIEQPALKPPKKRVSKPATLYLEPESLAPPAAGGLSLEGLGIDFEPPATGQRPSFDGDGDFEQNLDRLSLFAASLPSPLSPARSFADSPVTPGVSALLQGADSRSIFPGPVVTEDRTLVLPPRSTPEPEPPVPRFATRSREASVATTASSVSSSAAPSRKPSLLSIPQPQHPRPTLRSPPSFEQLVAAESEAYTSAQEAENDTDFLSSDDEESAHFRRQRFLGFGELATASNRHSGTTSEGPLSPDSSFATGASSLIRGSPVLGLRTEAGSRSSHSQERIPRERETSAASSSLWNEEYSASVPFAPGEKALEFVWHAQDVVNWRGMAIEKKELPAETTHLILADCQTPFQIAPLLTVTIPLLTHGLVVLDIGDCGLSEIPSAIASCCFLEELDIRGNPLATGTLPSFLGTLPTLHILVADSCNLSTLPNSLAQLSRLHTLALRHNNLRLLPSWLCRLSALDTLLVDDNPFHFQLHHLLRPLFLDGAAPPQEPPVPVRSSTPAPPSRPGSAMQQRGSTYSAPLPPGLADSPPTPPVPSPPPSMSSSMTSAMLPSPLVQTSISSPPIASPPAFSRSTSATPIYHAFSTPPPQAVAPAQIDLGQIQAELERTQHESDTLPRPSIASPHVMSAPVLSPIATPPPISAASSVANFDLDKPDGEGKEKRKWGKKLLKKVSAARMRSGSTSRPGQLDADSRTYSQPVTRGEESAVEERAPGLFGSLGRRRKSSKARRPSLGLALQGERTAPLQKRRSFLMLDAFPTPKSPDRTDAHTPTPPDYAAALRGVLAYLRDLDDLSPETTLPTIPLDATTPRLRHSPSLESTRSPSLRHSPSLGALSIDPSRTPSPVVMRRAQSTRRIPSLGTYGGTSPDPNRLSQFYEGDDRRSPTPLAASSSSSLAQSKLRDDPARREAVIKEIVDTEQSYLRGLEELCGIYVDSASVPISTSGTGKKVATVPAAERRAVFGNIEAIRDFHRMILLPDILAAARAGGDSIEVAGKVGEVFINHASFLKIYSSYINSFDDALARIQTWAKTSSSSRPGTAMGYSGSPSLGSSTIFDATAGIASSLSSSEKKRIRHWVKRCKTHPSHSQISLESYLLLPIQRIPRYRLLLESLAACTPAATDLPPLPALLEPTSPTASAASALRLEPHPLIAQAVQEMDAVAVVLNESKRENEGRAQLLVWQNRIQQKFKSSLVQPHRTLLRSGKLTLTRSVKRTTNQVEPPQPTLYRKPSRQDEQELFTLFQDTKQVELIGLLCSDLLVLVKAPPAPLDTDPNAPVELYTVLRLYSAAQFGGDGARGEPPISLLGPGETLLRVRVGEKAILYLQVPGESSARTRKAALEWRDAINLQWSMNG
ncbi:hypothetical protein JCM10207_008352 [Rhodosporidiobolus poonsookiae]